MSRLCILSFQWNLVCIILLLVCCSRISDTKYIEGEVASKKDFMFLAKFCYGEEGGYLELNATKIEPASDEIANNIQIACYNDEEDEDWYWPTIRNRNANCSTKVSNQQPSWMRANVTLHKQNRLRFTPTRRPHFWYLAIADCVKQANQRLKLQVRMHFTQRTSDNWYKEFSVEDQDLLTIYLVFFIIWAIGITPVIIGGYLLYKKDAYVLIIQLVHIAIGLEMVSLVGYLIHYFVYAHNGVGVPGLLVTAEVLEMFSVFVFMVLLLMVAKGVNFGEISPFDPTLKVDFIVMTTLFVLYAIFSMWQWIYPYLKPQNAVYKWESPPGIVVLIVIVLLWAYFIYSLIRKYKELVQAEQRYFLMLFGFLYTIWFLYLPLVVIVATSLPEYYRFKTVLGIFLSMQTLSYAWMCFLQWPSSLSRFFRIKKNILLPRVSTEDAEDEPLAPYGSL